jgi:hypothetical protein
MVWDVTAEGLGQSTRSSGERVVHISEETCDWAGVSVVRISCFCRHFYFFAGLHEEFLSFSGVSA